MANKVLLLICYLFVGISRILASQAVDRDALSLQMSRADCAKMHKIYESTTDNELRYSVCRPYFVALYKPLFSQETLEIASARRSISDYVAAVHQCMRDELLMSWFVESFEFDYAKGQTSYDRIDRFTKTQGISHFFDAPSAEYPITFLGSSVARGRRLPKPLLAKQDPLLHFLVRQNNYAGLQHALCEGQNADIVDGSDKTLIDYTAWYATDDRFVQLVHAFAVQRPLSVGSWYLQAMTAHNEVTAAYYAQRFVLEQMLYQSSAGMYCTLLQAAVEWLQPVYVTQLVALCVKRGIDVSQIKQFTGFSLLVYAVRKKIDAPDDKIHDACAKIVTSLRHAGCDLSFEEYARLRDHAHGRRQFARFFEVAKSSASCLVDLDRE